MFSSIEFRTTATELSTGLLKLHNQAILREERVEPLLGRKLTGIFQEALA